VLEALSHLPLERYPDREALALRRALSERLEVSTYQLVVGNGSSELLWLVALAFIRSRDKVLILDPTYGEYARAAMLMGASIESVAARPEDDFVPDLEEVERCLARVRPRVVFLCSPNNPTGVVVPPGVIAGWARANPETLFVVDEAYLAFAPGISSVLHVRAENILALCSMTKDHALAGLRLGYAAGGEKIVDAVARVRPPWNVNALAQAAGLAALADEGYFKDSLARLRDAKDELLSDLAALSFEPVPSELHFFLLHVGDGRAFRSRLLTRAIQVRDCASFGLPAYVRIAARRPEENRRLLGALREMRESSN
jgi:histidinol-phosphate aminotransferase